ncbi:hypothetical protein TNCV_702091 [Trichonephila clavipes]|nr:hypothetical protein TNCV_702091 [Trichonephila clavipes]
MLTLFHFAAFANRCKHKQVARRTTDVIDENITAMCSVKIDCPFNELGYWHVTNNLVMHDLLEGWCATETYLILHQYIFKDKFLALSVLNDRISNFNYGKCDSRCKPVPIKREKLSNFDGSNGQSASQMWHLTPKMHFALHYPRIIRQLGPPVSYWRVGSRSPIGFGLLQGEWIHGPDSVDLGCRLPTGIQHVQRWWIMERFSKEQRGKIHPEPKLARWNEFQNVNKELGLEITIPISQVISCLIPRHTYMRWYPLETLVSSDQA